MLDRIGLLAPRAGEQLHRHLAATGEIMLAGAGNDDELIY